MQNRVMLGQLSSIKGNTSSYRPRAQPTKEGKPFPPALFFHSFSARRGSIVLGLSVLLLTCTLSWDHLRATGIIFTTKENASQHKKSAGLQQGHIKDLVIMQLLYCKFSMSTKLHLFSRNSMAEQMVRSPQHKLLLIKPEVNLFTETKIKGQWSACALKWDMRQWQAILSFMNSLRNRLPSRATATLIRFSCKTAF